MELAGIVALIALVLAVVSFFVDGSDLRLLKGAVLATAVAVAIFAFA